MSVKVLLIDDDEDDFIIVRDLIRDIPGANFALEWARSFEQGLERWRGGGFELVLLDYRLGAYSGLELLRQIRESGSSLPVIMLTGQGDREIDVAAMQAGATDYLVKGELTAAILDRAMRYGLSVARLNQRLIDEHKRLMQIEKLSSIGMLAAGIVHEVNNPLAGVKSLAAALRDNDISQAKRDEYLSAIIEGLTRMGETIRGLLDLAREQPLSVEVLDAAELATSVLRLVGATLRAKGISAAIDIEPGQQINGDRSRLMQALLNLFVNASDATPAGGRIAIALKRRPGFVGLAVSDTGSGIPKEITERVVEAFFTTKPTGQGTGLGLAIVSSIAKAHGGSLSIESPSGQGATVTVWLPER